MINSTVWRSVKALSSYFVGWPEAIAISIIADMYVGPFFINRTVTVNHTPTYSASSEFAEFIVAPGGSGLQGRISSPPHPRRDPARMKRPLRSFWQFLDESARNDQMQGRQLFCPSVEGAIARLPGGVLLIDDQDLLDLIYSALHRTAKISRGTEKNWQNTQQTTFWLKMNGFGKKTWHNSIWTSWKTRLSQYRPHEKTKTH